MSYKHILVVVDLSPNSYLLIDKAIFLSDINQTKISLIYVNTNYSNMYMGFIDVDTRNVPFLFDENINNKLQNFEKYLTCSIYKVFIGNENILSCILNIVKKHNVDLIVFGHYQDFWNKIIFSMHQIINNLNIDILIVPINYKH